MRDVASTETMKPNAVSLRAYSAVTAKIATHAKEAAIKAVIAVQAVFFNAKGDERPAVPGFGIDRKSFAASVKRVTGPGLPITVIKHHADVQSTIKLPRVC